MGFLPKRLTLQNLDEVSVFIEDINNEYFNVQEVPETLTQGRYAFKIFGSDLLREGIDLKLELLDSEGNTIFLSPVDFIGEEVPPYVPYRYVTIEVYSPPINYAGIATLTILGEANPDIVDVPIEFQNAYNVRYQTTLNVDLSTIINTQPIRFFKNPKTEFQEVVQAKTVLSPISESIVTSTADGITRSDLKGNIIEIQSGSLDKEPLPNEISDTFKDIRSFQGEYKYKTGLRGKVPALIKRRGLSRRFASLEEPKFKIKTNSATFSSDMQGGTIEIPEREVTLTSTDVTTGNIKEETVTVPKYKSKILEVLDDKTIVPEEPPLVPLPTGSQPVGTDVEEVTIEDFSSTPITASFNVTNAYPSQSNINFDSLLDLTIKDMRTFSGDIYRIRVHGKSEAAGSDFTVLTDVIVESPELLVDSNSSSGVLRTGYFINQGHIETYWDKFSMDSDTKATNVSTTHNSSEFIDSLKISGSSSGQNQSVVAQTKSTKSFTIRKDVAYTLSAKIKGQTTDKTINSNGTVQPKGKLFFHLSGSNLNTSELVTSNTRFGFELTDEATKEPVVLQLDEDLTGIQNFETIEHTFKPKFNLDKSVNTDTVLQLRAESGEWFISDLSLKPAMDTGFSPDEFKLKVPIPRSIRPDRFDFLIEYFDINNNVAETVTILQDVPISGSALVIDGDGNLLTGSLFMGNAVDSGIEAAGINSAFVRSVGYEGFESASLGGKGGFMIFSGSVLPDSPDDYKGAGIEIHDGTTGVNESFLKFRTNPSQLDIKTSTFFLGKKLNPSNFISGSNGNLQISSSNFELSPEGNVTMSGEITAVGGTIGGFDIANTTISTTGVTLGNSTEDLFISSSAFKVDHSGNITASNIDLGGTISATSGDVGGFTINAGSLTAGTGESAITMSSADKIIAMGSGSTFNKGDLDGGLRVGIDTDGQFKFVVGSAASYIHADNTGVSIKSDSFDVTASVAEIDVDIFKLSANNLFISSSGGGFISAGNPRPTGIGGTNKGFYVQGDNGNVLFGNSNGSHIKFDGTTTSISASSFFLGSNSQFVSGSNGNVEISSSNFHLDNSGNVTMAGNVTANAGTLGGFTIGSDAISSDNFFISGAADNNEFFISSSAFNVKASGNVTASALQLSGGSAGGLVVSAGQIGVGEILKLKDSGQITGSNVLFSGGKIAAWNISGNNISSTGGGIRLNGNGDNAEISVNSHTFGNEGIQFGFNSGNPRFYVGDGAENFLRYDSTNGVNIKTLKATISGSEISLLTPKFYFGEDSNFISGSNGNIEIFNSGTTTLSGSQVTIETPKFFMGGQSQFISGSLGNIEISSSAFHLTPQGDVSASSILLGDKSLGDFLEFNSGVLTVQGEVFANSINTPATAAVPSSSITSDGFAKFVSASIGGWNVTDSFIFKSISGSAAHQDITRVYLSATQDNAKNIGEGLQIYRKDEDVVDGGVKVVRVGGLSDTTNLHANNEYGIQVIKQNSASDYANIMYIGPTTQSIAGWNISTDGFTDSAGSVQFSSTQASMSLGTGQEVVIRGNSNSPFISVQPAVALVDKSYGETGIFFGVAGGATPLFSAVGAGGHLKFNGSSIDINSDTAVISGSAVSLLTPKFYFGEDSNFISGSNGNISIVNTGTTTLSGSQVTIQTPKFFLGGDSQFVSGSNGNIEISSSNFHLQSDGDVVMSGTITAAAGEIGGFTIGNDLSNSGGSTLKLKGSTGQITASAAQIAGNITATSGQIAGFTVSGNTLTATNFTLDASGKSISLGTGNTIFIADADEGIQLGHASFNSAPFSVTKAGVLKATSGTVGGWTLGSNTIVGANLTLNSSGLIETNDFASGVKGFRLDSTNNGQAEFENISIRGTLKTTVFEKETVNAVGGQLYVANSTTLTGSLAISASAATMSVVNVTGFTGSYANDGEILVAKKVTDTGFSTEYILVQSASRDNPSSDKDFSGKLYVVRGYQSGSTGDFLGDNANQSHSLAPGQVLASTGRIGTGYIRLNANPNDTTTPYIDIVERTGSGVYDVDLKARLGDLSGLSTARLHGTNPASAGFGLYSQNVFLEGGIVANTGSIGGIEMEAGKLYNGAGVHGNSNTGFYVDSGSKFSLGDKLVWDGSDLSVEGSITLTGGTGVATPTDVSASLNASSSALQGNIDNVESNVSGAFTATSSSIATDLNTVESNISGAFTEVSASIVQNIVTDISGSILDIPPAPGGEGLFLNFPHMGYFSGSEFTAFISASGGFLFKADDNNLISFGQTVTGGDGVNSKSFVLKSDNVFLSGSKVNILGERFFLGGDSQFVSGSNGNIEISSSKFHVKPDGDIVVGKVNATEGSIGGFDIGISQISSSTGGLILNNDGGITGSKFLLEGGIITSDVTIQGSLSANSISTPTGSSPLAEITDAGFAKFISASIGGFEVSQTQINSTNDKLILKSNGQISASSAQISGEINITGGASKTHLDALGSQTASLNASISSIGETTASLNSATASIIANVSGAFDEASSSLASNINTVEANVSGAFTEVSESITSRIMTDVSGSILDIPASPSGEGLYLNYPYMGFYGPPEPSSTTYTVTAAGGVYYIDGVQQATLELQVGYTYRFDTSAVGSHPFRFSTDSDNDNAYTTGVTVGSGYVDITITSSTPSTLYYYCTNHANMGGQINVVDNSEFTAFISASGGFLFKADDDNLISFGQSVSGSDGTPTKSFVLKSDNVFLSGSNVSILGERFFLGGDSQFVSGSNGNIEISSSKFHLDSSGNVTMDGTVTATTGEIGGFTISSNSISSSNDILRLKSSGQITASAIQLTGEVNITGGSAKSHLEAIGESTASLNTSVVEIGQSTSSLDASVVSIGQQTASLDESVVSIGQQTASLDASVVAIGESTASLTTASQSMAARVSLTSTGVDIFDSGSNRIARYTDTATIGKTSYPDNNVFIDDDSVEIRRGSQVSASFGTTTTIGPTSNKHVKITSNALEIKTDANTTVLSASAAGLEMQGTINSTAGEIGGFGISATTISSSNSNLILNSNGQITASAVSMSGTVNATSGLIGGMRIESNSIESAADAGDGSTTTYTVTVNGSSKYEIDGVQQASLIFLPGNTYRFDQADDSNENHPLRFVQTSGGTDYYTTGVTINGTPGSAGAYTEIAVTQSTPTQLYYRCSAHSGMGGSITVDKTSPLILDGNTGQISGSRFLFSGGKISGSSVEIDVENITMSGSSVDIKTPKFFLGGSSQFVSGSNTNIEISSSNFHLQPDGNVIMSGTVTATTGELGGFAITPTAISESNNRLILRSDGRITASFMQMTGEVNIAGGSAQTHLELIGEQTASLNTSVVSIGAQTASLDNSVVSIGAQTASLNTSVVSIGAQTASLDNSVVSIGATTASLQTVTASLQTASSSMASTAALTSTGMDIFDSGSNRVARFSDSVTLGKTGDHSRTVISNQSIDMYGYSIDEGNVYKRFTIDSSGDDPIVAIGGSDDADVSTTSTNDVIRIHPDNGIFIYKNNSDFVKISGTGVDIHAGSSSVTAASFGTTTTIGATAGEHIKITSAALEVKTDANTTVLSASAAGLEMEGAVKATSGEIGGFLISQNEISSSLTPKRGLVLKPGDAISGFGNSAHSTETVQGMFSFGVASVAPPAGTDGSPLGKGFKGGVGAYAQQDEEITP